MKNQFIFHAILFILNISCDKKQADLELQNEVIKDIFLEIVDSTYIDRRLHTLFPENGKSVYDKVGKWLRYDSTSQKIKNLEWQKKIDGLRNDTLKLVIGIERLNVDLHESDFLLFYKYYKNLGKGGLIQNQSSESFPIDLKPFTKHKKFIFKNRTEFPEGNKIWEAKYPFQLGSILRLTNAQFDITKKFGFINVAVFYGASSGRGYVVYYKKMGAKWVIDKIGETWIS